MVERLQAADPGRFGTGGATRLYFDGEDVRQRPDAPAVSPDRLFAVDLHNPFAPAGSGFDRNYVNDVSITYKAQELKKVVDYVRVASGRDRVILIGHSMGGLVSRAYGQGLRTAVDRELVANGPWLPYEDKEIAAIVTINTPHRGASSVDFEELGFACAAENSKNKVELRPDDVAGSFVRTLNDGTLPPEIPLVSLQGKAIFALTGDGVVSYSSMDVTTGKRFYGPATFVQPIAMTRRFTDYLPPIPHLFAQSDANVIDYVASLIAAADNYWISSPLPGAPRLDDARVSQSTVSLSWTPATGSTPSSYELIAARSPGGIVQARLPVAGLSLVHPAVPDGVWYVKVSARTAAGPGPTSNEVRVVVNGGSAPMVAIDAMTPSPLVAGPGDQTLTFTGRGFESGLTLFATYPGGSVRLSGTQIASVSPTSFSVRATLGNPGAFTIRADNPSGLQSNIFPFTVVDAPELAPAINAVTPSPLVARAGDQLLTVSGSGFSQGLTVLATYPGGSTTLSGAQIQRVAPTSVDLLATLASPGTYTIRVRNPGGQGSNTLSFQVVAAGQSPVLRFSFTPSPVIGATNCPGQVAPCWRFDYRIDEIGQASLRVSQHGYRYRDAQSNVLFEGIIPASWPWGNGCTGMTTRLPQLEIPAGSSTCNVHLGSSIASQPAVASFELFIAGTDQKGRDVTFTSPRLTLLPP